MTYKVLGKTGLEVSAIGLGGIELNRIDEQAAIALVHEAIERGINLIDTAHLYSNSEERIGKALRGKRDRVIVVTKSMSVSREELLKDLECSLSRLRTDYIDIFLFHDASRGRFRQLLSAGLLNLLLRQKERGTVRYVGFSCHDVHAIPGYYEVPGFSVMMIPANFVSTEFLDEEVYGRAVRRRIGLLGMKLLGGGRIPDPGLCFRFIRRYQDLIPIVGMESIAELERNLEHLQSMECPSEADERLFARFREELGTRYCRDCGYCLPCPQGIDIPWINFIETNFRRLERTLVLNRDNLSKVQRVDDCTECRECEQKCPFHLKIVELIRENQRFFRQRFG